MKGACDFLSANTITGIPHKQQPPKPDQQPKPFPPLPFPTLARSSPQSHRSQASNIPSFVYQTLLYSLSAPPPPDCDRCQPTETPSLLHKSLPPRRATSIYNTPFLQEGTIAATSKASNTPTDTSRRVLFGIVLPDDLLLLATAHDRSCGI